VQIPIETMAIMVYSFAGIGAVTSRISLDNMSGHKPVEQQANGGQVLLN
jgi:hypothetical protein